MARSELRKLFPLFGAFAFLGLAPTAGATSFYMLPFPQSVKDAPVIVRGTVGMSYADWSGEDESKRIYTFTELDISEVFKGQVDGKTLIMRELGGEKDGIGMHVEGTAHFTRGEDTVVMLSDRNASGSYDLRAMMMGKFGIRKDPEDGQEYLVGPGMQSGTKGANRWTLDALRDLVRSQGDAPKGAVSTRKNTVIPTISARPAPMPPQTETTHSAAPLLQPQGGRDASSNAAGSLPWTALKWVGLGGLALIIGSRLKRGQGRRS